MACSQEKEILNTANWDKDESTSEYWTSDCAWGLMLWTRVRRKILSDAFWHEERDYL